MQELAISKRPQIREAAEVSLDSAHMTTLLLRVAEQDRAAFAELFEYFGPRLKAYMFKLGSSETMAEEMAQKTMLKIWQKAPLFDANKAAASTWIFRIARNLRIDDLRKEQRFEYDAYDFDAVADPGDNAEVTMDKAQHASLVQAALEHLTPDQRAVIDLSFYQGLSHGKIAEELNIPLGTVKSRIRLAFAKLEEMMGELR